MAYRWDDWTPKERADVIRRDAHNYRVREETLRELYQLTEEGLLAILRGCDWDEAFVDRSIGS